MLESCEDIHLELQRELEDECGKTYKEFAMKFRTMSDWIKQAKLEIKRRKGEKLKQENEEKERLRKEEKGDQLRREEKEDALGKGRGKA